MESIDMSECCEEEEISVHEDEYGGDEESGVDEEVIEDSEDESNNYENEFEGTEDESNNYENVFEDTEDELEDYEFENLTVVYDNIEENNFNEIKDNFPYYNGNQENSSFYEDMSYFAMNLE